MKILIVNACSNTPSGKAYFEYCSKLIKHYIQTQNIVLDTELQILKRDKTHLLQFLYELENSHSSLSAIQNFQTIDMYFVIGDQRLHPWTESLWDVNCLIRMCLRLKKHILLISDSVFQTLAFHLVSGLISNVSLINGPKGSNLVEINKYKQPSKKTDLFLDSVEGVLYAYNYQSCEWYRKKECGLINRYQMQQYYKNSKCYRIKEFSSKLMISKNTELQCHSLKDHYLFKGIKEYFVIEQRSKWTVNNCNFEFKELARSPKGPSIIQFQNAIGIHFTLSDHYEESLRILKNYIEDRLVKILTEPSRERTKDVMVNKERYNPTKLQIEKGRQLQFEKVCFDKVLLENQIHNNKLRKSIRPHTGLSYSTYKKITIPKQSVDQEQNLKQTKQNEEHEWTGQIVTVKSSHTLYKNKQVATWLKQEQIQLAQTFSTRIQPPVIKKLRQTNNKSVRQILSRYNYRDEIPEKWMCARNFINY